MPKSTCNIRSTTRDVVAFKQFKNFISSINYDRSKATVVGRKNTGKKRFKASAAFAICYSEEGFRVSYQTIKDN